MVRGFLRLGTPEQNMRDYLILINGAQHIIPEHIGEVSEVCSAVVYAPDDTARELHLGKAYDMLTPFPHDGLAEDLTPIAYRRISAVTLLTGAGIYLAVDSERTENTGGLAPINDALGEDFDEIFTGGLSGPDYAVPVQKRLDTLGLMRHASQILRLARIHDLTQDQTQFALAVSVSQLAMGMPMGDREVIEFAKMED